MYRTNNFGWKLVHVLCILAHLGLAVAGAVAYVYNASKGMRAVAWAGFARRSTSPCHDIGSQQFVFAGTGASGASGESGPPLFTASSPLVDVALHMLPTSCLAVVRPSFFPR